MLSLTFSPADADEFATSVPAKWRPQVDAWLRALQALQSGATTKRELCASFRVSRATLDRKIRAVEAHGWRGLVPNYKGPKAIPAEFVDYWKTMQETYQRNTAAAVRELFRRWQRREPIPGYPGHPGWPNLPKGWDERTLYRYQPSKLSLTAMRHGLGRAIAKHAPKTLSTRVGLWHLSHILYDDVWLDMKVHVLTSRQLCRVLQIGALDLYSGSRFHYGTKPQLTRGDGTKTNLTEADMRFALASQLYSHGISARGTTLVLEHGTATLRDNVIDILRRGFGDKLQVSLSGMHGKLQALAGLHEGRGGGNPRHKAALESLHNLIHNELAALPAQTGHDRDEPEFLHGIQREHEQLWKLAQTLGSDILEKLRFPALEYHSQFLPALTAILTAIDSRTDHDLEGWAELGFITRDYRLTADSPHWMSERDFLALPPPAQLALSAVASADPRCLRPRKLSPREVFMQGVARGETLRAPTGLLAEILFQDLAQPRSIDCGLFEFQDSTISASPLQFESRVTLIDGREMELPDHQTYLLTVNPFDPSVAWIYDRKGQFLGLAKRVHRHSRADADAARAAFGRTRQRVADLLSDTRRRHVGTTRAATDRLRHNAAVISSARQSASDLTRTAQAALDASITSPLTATTPTHEDPSRLW